MLPIYSHAACSCPCPCCMSISIVHVHTHVLSMVHVQSMLQVRVNESCPCPCCMFMSMLHVYIHVLVAFSCPCYMSMTMLHVRPCCPSSPASRDTCDTQLNGVWSRSLEASTFLVQYVYQKNSPFPANCSLGSEKLVVFCFVSSLMLKI
jgi:hypothetical protein